MKGCALNSGRWNPTESDSWSRGVSRAGPAWGLQLLAAHTPCRGAALLQAPPLCSRGHPLFWVKSPSASLS